MQFTNVKERLDDFNELWKQCDHREINTFSDSMYKYLIEGGFFTAPASTKYHGVYEGGLYDHSRAVYARLLDLTKKLNLEWQRPESPFIIAMFHDLCKCDQYIKVFDHYVYNNDMQLKGHGSKSVILAMQYIPLTEEEELCIRYHMGAYEKDDWAAFDAAIRKYPNVLYTHTADMLASKVDGT